MKKLLLLVDWLAFLTGCKKSDTTKIIKNDTISIELSVNSDGVPYISKVVSTATSKIILGDATLGKMPQDHLENEFLNSQKAKISPLSDWDTSEDSLFVKAKVSVKVTPMPTYKPYKLFRAMNLNSH